MEVVDPPPPLLPHPAVAPSRRRRRRSLNFMVSSSSFNDPLPPLTTAERGGGEEYRSQIVLHLPPRKTPFPLSLSSPAATNALSSRAYSDGGGGRGKRRRERIERGANPLFSPTHTRNPSPPSPHPSTCHPCLNLLPFPPPHKWCMLAGLEGRGKKGKCWMDQGRKGFTKKVPPKRRRHLETEREREKPISTWQNRKSP